MTLPTTNLALSQILEEFGWVVGGAGTIPDGTRLVFVEAWGGGGGSGSSATGNWPFGPGGDPIPGPGGGSGAYACAVITIANPNNPGSVSVSIGSGGSAQGGPAIGDPGSAPNNGNDTTVTVNDVEVTAKGGGGGYSYLTESSPGSNVYDVFNRVVGLGGSPNGNSGTAPEFGGGGGAALESDYDVSGTANFFGSSAFGAGGNEGGAFVGSSNEFTAGLPGQNGGARVVFIGRLGPNKLTEYRSGAGLVPPTVDVPSAGNISILDFGGTALVPSCEQVGESEPPPEPPPTTPPDITVTISTVTGPGGTTISTSPSGAAQFTPGGNATITINNANPFAGNQDTPTLSQSNSTCVGGVPPSITTVQSGQQWQFEFLVPPNNCTLEFIAGALLGGGGNGPEL